MRCRRLTLAASQGGVCERSGSWATHGRVRGLTLGPHLGVTRRTPLASTPPTETHTFELPEKKGVYGNKQWMYDLARSFVQGVRSNTAPEVGPAEARCVLRIIVVAYKSPQTRRWVDPPAG